MLDVFIDALLDTAKTLPFLFGAYLLMEFLEHKASHKFTAAITHLGAWGPVAGGVLGCVPQCGFSVAAANFYAGRMITPGTLVAVFLATSDEALLLMISHPEFYPELLRLILVKLCAAVAFGLLIDLLLKKRRAPSSPPFQDICEDCDCEHRGVVRSAVAHTLKIVVFLLIINLILGYVIYFVGEDAIAGFLLSGSVFQPLLAGLIGFIPNCAASVILTELYMEGALSFGAAVAGLCTGAGLGLAVLFRTNKKPRENFALMAVLYVCAVITGFVCTAIFG